MKRFPKFISTSSGKNAPLDLTRVLVALKKDTEIKEVDDLVKKLKLEVEAYKKSEGDAHWKQVNHGNRRFWLKSADGKAIDSSRFNALEKNLKKEIDWIGPVYQHEDDSELANCSCPIPNVILVMKGEVSDINKMAKEYGCKLNKEKSQYLHAFYYLEVEDVNKNNAYELKSKLEKQGKKVMYENMPMLKPLTAIPNDPLYGNQWDMVQINAPSGWDITTGSNSVVVCVLDQGCDLTHPDLIFSEPGINLNTMLPPGSPTGAHGTACAGIATASFNNAQGIAGVAGSCRVLPVAFQFWTDVECAMGITYATIKCVDTISMSFGVYDGWGWNYALIDPAIQNAFDNNVVLVAATGNENIGTNNRYPSRHPLVIAVGGSSTDDNRKTPASPDGEFWGANYGTEIYNGVLTGVSVVAPCVLCPTTDIQGGGGYGGGNYINNFNGTSSATPHVAGLAALIKSKYPTLTNVQVRNAIEVSAAKVGSLPYVNQPGFPVSTRNQEMGYGRIDVAAALKVAKELISCADEKAIANIDLLVQASKKFNHLQANPKCPSFKLFTHIDKQEEKCEQADVPRFNPCFYLHWGDGNQDNIETEDFEVVILSVCNPYSNIAFKDLKISNLVIIHPDGSLAELLPDGTSSAYVVPSRLITFCEIGPCSCCHIELVVKTSGALAGPYKISMDYCIEETCLLPVAKAPKAKAEFKIDLVKS